MKNAADFSSERFELFERVVEGIALVDDAIQPGFGGDIQLLPENFGLFLFVARVVFGGAAGLLARQTMVIKADFTDGDDFRMLHQLAQRLANIVRCFVGV